MSLITVMRHGRPVLEAPPCPPWKNPPLVPLPKDRNRKDNHNHLTSDLLIDLRRQRDNLTRQISRAKQGHGTATAAELQAQQADVIRRITVEMTRLLGYTPVKRNVAQSPVLDVLRHTRHKLNQLLRSRAKGIQGERGVASIKAELASVLDAINAETKRLKGVAP